MRGGGGGRGLSSAMAGSLTVALATGAFAGAGCGKSQKPLTRAQLLVKADAICRHIEKKLSSFSAKNEKEFIRLLPRLAGYEQQGLAELSKLVPPAQMADDWKTIVAGASTLADSTAKLAEAARAKDLKTAHAITSEIGKVQQRTIAVAKRNGFKECSQTP